MKTHCIRGHEFTPENIKIKPHSNGKSYPECRVCERERNAIRAENKRLTRKDALPEGFNYPDEGCAEASSCLSCPLDLCVHDTQRYARLKEDRNRSIYEAHKKGVSNDELQKRFKLGWRQISRIIEAKGAWFGQPMQFGENDVPGKPVSEISNGIKPRRKPPVMRENLRWTQ